jgi:hypothetical protein
MSSDYSFYRSVNSAEVDVLFPNLRVQTGPVAHPAPYPMGTRRSFPGDKAAGA